MKSLCWFLAIMFCLMGCSAVHAKDTDITVVRVTPNVDLDQVRYILSHHREEVFERGMRLEPKQWQVFWKVYDDYDKERQQLDAKRLRLLGGFINKNAALTDDEATRLMEASGENQQADLALRQKYFKVLSAQINPVAAARFAQLDDLVGMVIRLAILGNVPLISGVSDEGEGQAGSPESASQTVPQQ
ncbi:MAG TPA: hypothetical protein VJ746_05275 [Nitrospira sp.]|nr:hypothetical protein [Nitrospira sp.]